MKTIWIFNHYATDSFFQHGGRHYSIAKYLINNGYDVKIFCASTIHNNDKNLIKDHKLFYEDSCDGIPYIFIRTRNYKGNGIHRIMNMIDFYQNLFKVAKHYPKPDVIIGSSVHPLACVAAIKLAKIYHCNAIAEIRDLWPESIVSYHIASKNNLLITMMYKMEEWIYTKADDVIFTMEGGFDYIVEKGWDKAHGGPVDLKKIHYVSNGVDLQDYEYNKNHYKINDFELDNAQLFKVVYTGSLRKANSDIYQIIGCAEELQKREDCKDIKILVWGRGDIENLLISLCKKRKIQNIIFKGFVDKKFIPFILSNCNLCILNCVPNIILKFGGSQNKLFDYLASGCPVISGEDSTYSIVTKENVGYCGVFSDSIALTKTILNYKNLPIADQLKQKEHILSVAKKYDYQILTDKMIMIIEHSEIM